MYIFNVRMVRFEYFVMWVASLVTLILSVDSEKSDTYKLPVHFASGDPQNCPQESAAILEALPGSGWDNLLNVDMGQVLMHNFSNCRMSNDRVYLVPNSVHLIPLKKSNVEVYSEFFDHYTNYTSMTSRSINVGAYGSNSYGSISGSYSQDYQENKQHQVDDSSYTTRVQLRYLQYKVRTNVEAQLHPVFKSRLLEIASYIQINATEMTNYSAQLLIRDFGTHYVSSVDVGAVLFQEDHINSSIVIDFKGEKNTITASASASFLGIIGADTKFTTSTETDNTKKYQSKRTHSHVGTHGGPSFRVNMTLDDWVGGLKNELVAINRDGDPLHYAITRVTMAELPELTIHKLSGAVRHAIDQYYLHNVYRGCMDLTSHNFNYLANFDDGSCEGSATNFTFGGIYQTCKGGFCSEEYAQVNPLTGEYKCSDDYEPVLLYTGTRTKCQRRCKHFWFLRFDCYDDCTATHTLSNAAHYEAYWCSAKEGQEPSGYLFGGAYTTTSANALTKSHSCPMYFYALKFGKDMFVCVSDDYELGFRYSVPFAGFFSCSHGNPLAIKERENKLVQVNGKQVGKSLSAFVYASGAAAWPKRCPHGYSQHLLSINEGCDINYCVKVNALSGHSVALVRRPPFSPGVSTLYKNTGVLITAKGHVMYKDEIEGTWIQASRETARELLDNSNPELKNNSGVVIGLSVTVAALVILVIVLIYRMRGQRLPNKEYTQMPGTNTPTNNDSNV